jgi:hypothetical protein
MGAGESVGVREFNFLLLSGWLFDIHGRDVLVIEDNLPENQE